MYGEVSRKPQEFGGCSNQRRSIPLVVQAHLVPQIDARLVLALRGAARH
jgi:hypothetical protein